jgi:hypothetical protein
MDSSFPFGARSDRGSLVAVRISVFRKDTKLHKKNESCLVFLGAFVSWWQKKLNFAALKI